MRLPLDIKRRVQPKERHRNVLDMEVFNVGWQISTGNTETCMVLPRHGHGHGHGHGSSEPSPLSQQITASLSWILQQILGADREMQCKYEHERGRGMCGLDHEEKI